MTLPGALDEVTKYTYMAHQNSPIRDGDLASDLPLNLLKPIF